MTEKDVKRAVEILRWWQEWSEIGKKHIESGDPWPNTARQSKLYRKLWLAVHRGEIRTYKIDYIGWHDNEIGAVGKAIQS